jgi:hypothetical protein
MNGDLGLEQRYRRVLRLLPGYYRAKWEEDMVATFLDSWMSGDPEDDAWILEFGRPGWPETASVATLAARLYLGGAGAPRRYFAWGQAVRGVVLTVMLVHATLALDTFVRLGWDHHLFGVPTPPALLGGTPGGIALTVTCVVACAWIVVFAALLLGQYRVARVIAALTVLVDLTTVLQHQLAGTQPLPYGAWAFWLLLDLAPALAMAAFHRDAPPPARWPWLLALPVNYLVVVVPLLVIEATGYLLAWVPDFPGLCCLLVALVCLAHAPRAWSLHSASTGVWSLTLALLAAVATAERIISLGDYLHDSHLMRVGVVELIILAAATALIIPDAARTQTAVPASPPRPQLG